MPQQELVGSKPIPHYGQHGGMDYGTEPHLLDEKTWRFLDGMSGGAVTSQILSRKLITSVKGTYDVEALVNLPNGRLDYGLWLAFSKDAVKPLRLSGLRPAIAALNPCEDRIVTHVYNGRVFFTNKDNRVRFIDSNGVHELFDHRRSWTKDNGELLNGNGPFTKEPLYGDNEKPEGDLGALFTWTTGQSYRVYVATTIPFRRFDEIGVIITKSDGTQQALTGTVTTIEKDYLVVLATDTVVGVENQWLTQQFGRIVLPPALVRVTSTPVPAGRYVTMFFDHVVVGAPCWKGVQMHNKTMWSHLYDFAEWKPESSTEADSYTHSEYQYGDDIVSGVSGMAHFGELLLISTTSCIYAMSYTGLPRVVRVAPLIQGYGNGLPYAMAQLDRGVVWCDVHHRSFFAFRGQGPEDIGQSIADYFFSSLTANSKWAARTWSYVNRAKSEVGWVYVSTASVNGTFDRQIVFNYKENTWSIRNGATLSAFGVFGKRAKTIKELTGTIDSNTAVIDELEETSEDRMVVWGGNEEQVWREEVPSDLTANLVNLETIRLETGDLIYGSAQKVKEVSQITINAGGTVLTGIKVYVSAREHMDDVVVFTEVGTWTPTIKEKMLTFSQQTGKILRYAFVPVGSPRGFIWRGYEDNVLGAGADR